MHNVKALAVFTQNKQGQIARVTKILADALINIRLITIADSNTSDYGVMKLVVTDPRHAYDLLKAQKFAVTLIDAIAIDATDQPGALHKITTTLANARINISNLSGYVANNHAVILLELAEKTSAISALRAANFRVLSEEEMLSL